LEWLAVLMPVLLLKGATASMLLDLLLPPVLPVVLGSS
jgi:hypothetical protein